MRLSDAVPGGTGLADLTFRPRNDAPIWQQIYDHLLTQIITGSLRPGGQLPGEHHLAQSLGVTRPTLRQALHQLQREGHLTARKGVGIFVRNAPASFTVRDGSPFIESLDARGKEVDTRTIQLERSLADPEVAHSLRIAEGSEIIRMARIRIVDQQPVYINEKAFPAQRFPGFEAAYAPHHSVTAVYVAHGVSSYRRVETRIRGGFASAQEAAALNLTPATPIFHTTSINEDQNGERIEWTRGCWPLTSVEFVFEQ